MPDPHRELGISHTSDATSAAGVYVGMTRGRETNRLHIVAENLNDARTQFVAEMERDPADRGLDHATQQAAEAVQGLIADGPLQRVNEAIARLTAEATAEQVRSEITAPLTIQAKEDGAAYVATLPPELPPLGKRSRNCAA